MVKKIKNIEGGSRVKEGLKGFENGFQLWALLVPKHGGFCHYRGDGEQRRSFGPTMGADVAKNGVNSSVKLSRVVCMLTGSSIKALLMP